MKKPIGLLQLVGFAVTSLGGTLLHFLYDFSGGAIWIAPFSGVNESTWEHMKLLFWPLFIFTLAEWLFFRDRHDFLCVKLRGTLLGLALIPLLFYSYNGIIGKSCDIVNISIFFISAAAVFLYEARRLYKGDTECKRPRRALVIFILIGLLFVIFTFATPHLAIFRDPLTGAYGI